MSHDPVMVEKMRQVSDSLKRGRAGHAYGGTGDRFMMAVGAPTAVKLPGVKGFIACVGIDEEQARDLRASIDIWLTERGMAKKT